MKDWSGLAVIILAFLIFVLQGLFKDKDPYHMNPRREIARERNKWHEFQRTSFAAIILSFLAVYLLVHAAEWIWTHWWDSCIHYGRNFIPIL